MREKLAALKAEIFHASKYEKLFIFSAMLCGFFISAEYAIIRPLSNSLFIHSYSSHFFPYAWLATVPVNLLIVSLYNRYLQKLGCLKMFLMTLFCVAGIHLLCALFIKELTWLPFLLYVWKEIYVLLLFQQLWSVIHSTTKSSKAKYLYGILFGIGGLGGVIGSSIPGFLAVKMGSESLFFLTFPFHLGLLLCYILLIRNSDQVRQEKQFSELSKEAAPSFWHGVKLISSSRYLIFILSIVVFMQFSSTIIDYQFNSALEATIPQKDLRTEYAGRVMAVVNIFTIALQFVGTFLLVHFLGMRRSHLMIPCMLCLNGIGFLLFPFFGMASICYITIKSFDFSIFGIIKEMLYLPLKVDEKFRAKAVIDVFAYRTSKALASFLILSLHFIAGAKILSFLSWGCILVFLLWMLIVARMLKTDDAAALETGSIT